MKTNLAIITVSMLCILLITLTGAAHAQIAAVGVNEGNVFTYSYTITWNSTDPQANVPNEYVDINNTNFIRFRIVKVTNTLINIDFTRNFKNGTDAIQNGNIDVNSQILEIPYGVLIIRANANPNEKIYPAGGYATLKETYLRTYSIGEVETIYYITPETSGTNHEKTEIYYDRSNGVGLEYNYESQQTSGSYVTTTKVTLVIMSWDLTEKPISTPSSSAAPSQSPIQTSTPTQKPTVSSSPNTTPSQTGFIGTGLPMEYGIAIIVVVLIAVVAGVGFAIRSKRKLKISKPASKLLQVF